MRPVLTELADKFRQAFADAFGPAFAERDALLRPATDARFGHYQSNAAMGLAKELKAKPRDVAQKIIDNLDLAGMAEAPEIAGPGFINLRLSPAWMARVLRGVLSDPRVGIGPAERPQRVVVDYSGPNIAKEMHVGHLRGTIIGDAIARTLEFLGEHVIRQNHIGDWGLQMGMVTYAVEKSPELGRLTLAGLEDLYRQVSRKCEEDPDGRRGMIAETRRLQQMPKDRLAIWQQVRTLTLESVQTIYERLDIGLRPEDVRGESFYSDEFGPMIEELKSRGLAVETEGAVGVFPPGFVNKEGQPRPFIIQSRDGTYQYPTFDLAALRYRVRVLGADRIIYTHDSRQAEHFAMLFAVAQLVGYAQKPAGGTVRLDYTPFGAVLGEDGRPLKTRTGENVKLADLIDEAEGRAFDLVTTKNPDLPEPQRRAIAHAVGVGAVKYADLAQSRTSDYVFSFDKMLALEGNTAPYLMYAYARIKSIERKGEIEAGKLSPDAKILLDTPPEQNLALRLLQFADILEDLAANLRPNILTNYLYELTQAFSVFYENCPVLKADTSALRVSRLWLADLAARTLAIGLNLLGIRTLEQM